MYVYVTFRRRCFVTKYRYSVQVFRYEIPLRGTGTGTKRYKYKCRYGVPGYRYRCRHEVQVQV
jgi:hypothetical protein